MEPLLFFSEVLKNAVPSDHAEVMKSVAAIDDSLKSARADVPGCMVAINMDTGELLQDWCSFTLKPGGPGSEPWIATHRVNFMRTSPLDLPLMGLAASHLNIGSRPVYYHAIPFLPILKKGATWDELPAHMPTNAFKEYFKTKGTTVKVEPGLVRPRAVNQLWSRFVSPQDWRPCFHSALLGRRWLFASLVPHERGLPHESQRRQLNKSELLT